MHRHMSTRLIVCNFQLGEDLYSCDHCNVITILKMSKRKHVFRGNLLKEFKSARNREGYGDTYCVVCDSEIYLVAMVSSSELSQEILSNSKLLTSDYSLEPQRAYFWLPFDGTLAAEKATTEVLLIRDTYV